MLRAASLERRTNELGSTLPRMSDSRSSDSSDNNRGTQLELTKGLGLHGSSQHGR